MKKRLISILLLFAMIVSLVPTISITASMEGQEPQKADPDTEWCVDYDNATEFVLYDVADLEGLASLVNDEYEPKEFEGKTVKLADTFSCGSYALTTPIGMECFPFKGTFDGNGQDVALNINLDTSCVGMFGHTMGAEIKDLSTSGKVTGKLSVGGIVGQSDRKWVSFNEETYVTTYAGTTVSSCSSSAELICTGNYNMSRLGGIVGENFGDCSVTGCSFSGSVNSDFERIGGIVGENSGTVTECTIKKPVSASNATMVGGIVGFNWDSGIIIGCSVNTDKADVTGNQQVGGIAGLNKGKIQDCHLSIKVTGTEKVGGIAGLQETWEEGIFNCSTTGEVSGEESVGGIVGDMNAGSVKNCFATGKISATECTVGGIVGYAGGSITDCYATGAVSGKSWVGGLVGFEAGWIENCFATGNVTGSEEKIGGLIGDLQSSCTVLNSYATGNVTATGGKDDGWGSFCANAGGVVGNIQSSGGLINCYSLGDVSGVGSNIGGVAGKVAQGGYIINCYWAGNTITGNSGNVGCVAGYYNDATINKCYYPENADCSAIGESNDGEPETIAVSRTDMKRTFGESNALVDKLNECKKVKPKDYNSTVYKCKSWTIEANTNRGYPTFFAPKTDWYDETESVFELKDTAELEGFAKLVNNGNDFAGKTVKLADNFANMFPFSTPIGWYDEDNDKYYSFKGTFDGNAQEIRLGIDVDYQFDWEGGSCTKYMGLFGLIDGATLINVYTTGSVSCKISVDWSAYPSIHLIYIGSICGKSIGESKLINCASTAAVTTENKGTSGKAYVGGLVGCLSGSLINSYSSGTVNANTTDKNVAGGLVGDNYGTLTNCYSVSTVTGNSNAAENTVGLIIGVNNDGGTAGSCYYLEAEGTDAVGSDPNVAADTGMTAETMKLAAGEGALVTVLDAYARGDGKALGCAPWEVAPDVNNGYPTLCGYFAEILENGKGYYEIADAVKAAQADTKDDAKTVLLIKDITSEDDITAETGKFAKFDLNEHKVLNAALSKYGVIADDGYRIKLVDRVNEITVKTKTVVVEKQSMTADEAKTIFGYAFRTVDENTALVFDVTAKVGTVKYILYTDSWSEVKTGTLRSIEALDGKAYVVGESLMKDKLTLEVNMASSVTYSGSAVQNPTVTAKLGSDVKTPVAGYDFTYYAFNNEGQPELISSAPANVGSYKLVVQVKSGDPNFCSDAKEVPFAIAKATNTVSELALDGWTYGEEANTPSAKTLFGGTVTYEYKLKDSEDAFVSFTTPPTNAGTYTLRATSATDGSNYDADSTQTVEFVIGKAVNTISGLMIDDWKVGEAASTPTASAVSGSITYAYKLKGASDSDYQEYTLDSAPAQAGTYVLRATSAADDNYESDTDTVYFVISTDSGADAGVCKYTVPLAPGEAQTLILGGREAGKYSVVGNQIVGFKLRNEDGKYVAIRDNALDTASDSPFTWCYDGGLCAEVKITETVKFLFWNRTKIKTVQYHLTVSEGVLSLTECPVPAGVQVSATEHTFICIPNPDDDATHIYRCTKCSAQKGEPVAHTYDTPDDKCICGKSHPVGKLTIEGADKAVCSDTLTFTVKVDGFRPEGSYVVWDISGACYQYTTCNVRTDSVTVICKESGKLKVTARLMDRNGCPITDEDGRFAETTKTVTVEYQTGSITKGIVKSLKSLFGIR